MITALKSRPFAAVFGLYCAYMLKKHFSRILIAGEDNIASCLPGRPTIFFANHSSWWDAILPLALSEERWSMESYAMMDEAQLTRFKFFRRLGTFSVDRSRPRESMRSILYAADVLRGSQRALWIYPQGELLPNDTRPLTVYGGLEHIVKRIGAVNLVPIAFRYEFLHEQRPEIFIGVGMPMQPTAEESSTPGVVTSIIADSLTNELEGLRSIVLAGEYDRFQVMLRGRRSVSTAAASLLK